jgi:CheY-like chemotaxis protein
MKLMLALGAGDLYAKLDEILKPLAVETIIYRHIQKAMDNVEEVDPDVIIIDAGAFPRHWKSFVQFIRETGQRKHCPVVLIKGKNFSQADKNKAVFLGVDAVVSDSFTGKEEIVTIQSIINASIPDGQHKLKIENDAVESRFGLLVTHPITGVLLSGTVQAVSEEGIIFYPDRPALAETIPLHAELYACSFRAGDTILSPVLRLVKRDTNLYFVFVSFPGNEQVIFNNYYVRINSLKLV